MRIDISSEPAVAKADHTAVGTRPDLTQAVQAVFGKRRLLSITLALLVFAIVYILVDSLVLSSFARLVVEMEGSVSSNAKAYYSTNFQHDAFSERQAATSTPYAGGKRVTLQFNLGNSTVKKLRFDPGNAPGTYKIYAISLDSFFGPPVKLDPFAPNLEVKGGPGTVATKMAQYLEISSQTDDPYCIFNRHLAVHNPYFQFGVPLVFAILTFIVVGRLRPEEFRFWRDVREKKSSSGLNFQALDGLRGLAALLVMLDHSGVPGCDGIGMVGVVMFFSLSGFLLTIPFAKDDAKILNLPYSQDFYLRRICRIIPMFYAMVLSGYIFNNHIEDALRSALFLQADSIYWTVQQEIHFYFLLPAVMLVNHLFLRGIRWLIVLFLFALSYGFNHNILATYEIYGMGVPLALLAGIFLAGMMTCYLFHMQFIKESLLLKKLCDNHFLTLALFVTVLTSQHLWSFTHAGKIIDQSWVLVGNFNYLVALMLFVLVMSRGSCVAKILGMLPLRLLGLVSYSFYLLHPIFINIVTHVSQGYVNIGNTGVFAVALVVTFLVSTVTYTLIERPFLYKR